MKTFGELILVWDSLSADSVKRLNGLKRPRKIAPKRLSLARLINWSTNAYNSLKRKIKGEMDVPTNLNGLSIGELLTLMQSTDPALPFELILHLDRIQIALLPIAESVGFLNFIKSELERINALFDGAKTEPTAEEKQAGCANVGKSVGSFGMIDYVAKRCACSHEEAERMPWPRVLAMMRLDRDTELYKRALQDVYANKNKR